MSPRQAKLFLEAEGIVCSGCAADMETVLRETDGILKVAVSYAKGTIIIDYDPSEIDQEALVAKVNGFGIKTRIVEPI